MTDLSFDEFLGKKIKSEKINGTIDWNGRREAWVEQINKLFIELENIFKPYKDKGMIVQCVPMTLYEDFLGTYNAQYLILQVGNDLVKISPVGSLIIGAFGKVIVEGPKGKFVLLLKDNEQVPKFKVEIVPEDGGGEKKLKEDTSGERLTLSEKISRSKWYLYLKRKEKRLVEFNEGSFKKEIMNILTPA